MGLGLMVLREFIGTIYHEVEIHESGAFERGVSARPMLDRRKDSFVNEQQDAVGIIVGEIGCPPTVTRWTLFRDYNFS